jgi:hypothetical protein
MGVTHALGSGLQVHVDADKTRDGLPLECAAPCAELPKSETVQGMQGMQVKCQIDGVVR